jgi:hypothetical protein
MVTAQSSMAIAISEKAASLITETPGLPQDIANDLAALKKRASAHSLQALAYRLCTWMPQTTSDIARLLNRNDAYSHTSIIRPLVLAGSLEMTIPDQPKHPEQRYRATNLAPETAT